MIMLEVLCSCFARFFILMFSYGMDELVLFEASKYHEGKFKPLTV